MSGGCPFAFWTLLPLELRRRLRVLPVHQIGLMGANDTRVPAHPMDVLTRRVAHLRDLPPACCKEHQ